MTFDDLWDEVVKQNKNLQIDKEVRMTVNGFKKAVKLAYEKGYDEGIEKGYDDGKATLSVFENIFGRDYNNSKN